MSDQARQGPTTANEAINAKEQFVIDYLIENNFVDVLNADFMWAFAEQFGCNFRPMSIGAPRVPLASKTLARMHRKGMLSRFATGLGGGEGFPNWVYSYELSDQMRANIAHKANADNHPQCKINT